MMWSDSILRIFFLSLAGPGIGGNFFVFVRHMYVLVKGPEKKTINLILMHLTFSNSMILSTTGVSYSVAVSHFQNFLGNVGCKIGIYLGRVARGLSICTTCLLTVFQAITISPMTTTWMKLKVWIEQKVLTCFLLFWISNSLISSNLLYYITAVNSINQSGTRQYLGYCSMLPSEQIFSWLFLTLMTLRDIIFQSLMALSSGYMVFHLYKHHECVLYLQSSRVTKSNKTSPEIRATQSILILMACFLFFYWADFIFSLYIGSLYTDNIVIYHIKIFLELSYATLSPFMLVGRGGLLPKCWPTH